VLKYVVVPLLLLGAGAVQAQDTLAYDVITLRMPAAVRSAGLNGAGAALVGTAGAVFSNPAGLATISNLAMEGGYQEGYGGRTISTAAMAWRMRQFNIGFGVQHTNFESPFFYDPLTAKIGVPDELTSVGTLVYRFGMIAVGGSVRYARRRTKTEIEPGVLDQGVFERGLSGDVGITIAFFDIMALGFSVQNVTDNFWTDSEMVMPRLSRFGFTMNYTDPLEEFRLLSTLEVQWPEGLRAQWLLGGEAGIVVAKIGVVGRLAYRTRADYSERASVTYGVTLELSFADVDFAYEPHEFLDTASRRIGARIGL